MRDIKRLATLCLVVCLLLPVLEARTRKGEKLLSQGREAEVRKQWETALDFYEQALLEDPADAAYQLAVRRVRFQASMSRLGAGQKLRAQGKLEEALHEFQRAYAIDPSSSIAEQEIRRTHQMIEREKSPATRSSTAEERGLTPAEKAQQQAEEKADRILPLPELKPIQRQIDTLKMNNQPVKVLYETVGKLAGVNVIMDPEFQSPPGKTTFTVDLSNTTLEQALDYLAIQTKSYWKPLSSNTIFVTNDNVTKRRDYEDYVVKVFYVKNATTVQELQELSTTVRSVTEIRRSFVYNAQNAILVRGTADQISLAEKLIQDLDKPRAEVVVDVIVMEANRGRVRDLAATFTTNGAPGINVPVFYNGGTPVTPPPSTDGSTPGTPPTGTNAIPLDKLASLGWSDFSINAPGALLQALMSDSTSRVLQQPQVRAVDNYKASLKIGDRIPYATGSFQPGVGTVGLNPLVSTQFNFLDTGVNLDITPKVHSPTEVSLHVEVDISTKSGEVDLGGLRQPIVSRRTVAEDIRLREGEINILGGLLASQETKLKNGVPGLMDIPILGRLFTTEKLDTSRGELLIVLVPHIVRMPDFSETNLRGVAAGNDQNVRLNFAPKVETAPVVPPPAPASETAPATPAQPAASPALTFNVPSAQTQLNSPVTISLQLENVNDLLTAPLKIRFDPKVLRLNSIQPGALLSGDGQKINFTENTLNDIGEATVNIGRIPGSGGVSGSGVLLTLTFQPVARGASTVSVVDSSFRNLQMQPITVTEPTVNIVVQ
jgi:general secretion pathway protein D